MPKPQENNKNAYTYKFKKNHKKPNLPSLNLLKGDRERSLSPPFGIKTAIRDYQITKLEQFGQLSQMNQAYSQRNSANNTKKIKTPDILSDSDDNFPSANSLRHKRILKP